MLLWAGSSHDPNPKQPEGDSDASPSKREPTFLALLRNAAMSGPRRAREFKKDGTTATDATSGLTPDPVEDEGRQWEPDLEYLRRTR